MSIPAEKIARLAELYDRFANALDPFSEVRDQAEQAFYLELDALRSAYALGTNERDFRRAAVRQCRLFLRKN